ncbi:MAG: hypothetical protein NEA02_04275 [Thermoanaerobaculia bacterium]|nr:hypothetical protein [Thermoanaerobaculia bacterium]
MRHSRLFRDAFLVVVLAAPLAAPLAAQPKGPDLVISFLSLAPESVAPGGSIDIVSEIRNVGTVAVPSRGPTSASAGVHLRLVRSAADVAGGDEIPGWGPLVAIPPGTPFRITTRFTVPASKPPGAYFVCAEVDADHLVTESDESNNRRCKPLTVTGAIRSAGPPSAPVAIGLPDLIVTGVSAGGVTGLSRSVKLTVKNAGAGPATNFRMDAYQLAPRRWQLLFTVCAQTSRGGSASCPGVWEAGTLAAGASRTYAGWVTFPADHKQGSTEKVEFMADGCFPALEPALPASCRVVETNEANNTAVDALGVP